ncbi:MAG: MBL fold metallo-hydrolase [Pseudomonadota bacterium]
MKFQQITPGVFMATRSGVNVFALQTGSDITLIDCGTPRCAPHILNAVQRLGTVRNIIVTHAHYDHAGGAAQIAAATGAPVWMHPADAQLVARGRWRRPAHPSGSALAWVMVKLLGRLYPDTLPAVPNIKPTGDTLDIAGGIKVHHMPGHCAGQIALEWHAPDGRCVIFGADVCMTSLGLMQPLLYEDTAEGLNSIKRLADLARTATVVVFGHGKPLWEPGPKLARFASG